MSITFKYDMDGEPLIITYCLPSEKIDTNKKYTYCPLSKGTIFCTLIPNSSLSHIIGVKTAQKINGGNVLDTKDEGNPHYTPKSIMHRRITAPNGNYALTYINSRGYPAYRMYDRNNKHIIDGSLPSVTAMASTYIFTYETYEQFVEKTTLSYAYNMYGYSKPDLPGQTDNTYIKVSNRNQFYIQDDMFRALLLLSAQGEPDPPTPIPLNPNDPFGPDVTTPDSVNKPDGEFDQNGEFHDVDDKIDDTQIPPDTSSAVGTGFISLYTPTYAQLTSLSSFLWSPTFTDSISKLFANPFEVIMNLHSLPFAVPQGAVQNIKCGNVDTKVSAPLVMSQYYTYDFGKLKIPKYSGTYLDYSPYTSYRITLPYLSSYVLNTDEITGKTLGLKYHIDVATGDTVAVISVDGQDTYTFTGNCATNIPITQGDYSQYWQTLAKASFDGIQTVATFGMLGAKVPKKRAKPSKRRQTAIANQYESLASGGGGALSSAVENVMSQKPDISTSGVLGSNFGNFGCLRPYITKTKPNLLIPENQQTYTGWASYFVTSIGDCKGYNEFTNVILGDMGYATEDEKDMIIAELESGVII